MSAVASLSVFGANVKSTFLCYGDRQIDCLNPITLSIVALFPDDHPAAVLVPDIFGYAIRVPAPEWRQFRDAVRQHWLWCCNDAADRQVQIGS